jgi:formate hydrogenlyase transcriptional activator
VSTDPAEPARAITPPQSDGGSLPPVEVIFRALVESVKEYAIFILDSEGRVSSWSAAAERMKGYVPSEILGQHFSCFYTPEDVERGKPAEELRVATETGRVEDEGWRVRKDGSRFWANVVITRIDDEAGNLAGFAKITRDFTERQQAEQQLAKQAALLELAHDSIIVRDLQSLITFWNHGAEENYGWTREEALGKVSHTFLQTEFPQPFEVIEQQLRQQHYWQGELVHTTKSGQKITVASRQVLQCDARGNPTAIFEINNDITDRKLAERELKRSEGHLRALFEFSPDAIVTSDSSGTITALNSQAEKSFGYNREELVGQSVDALVPERFRRNHPGHRADYNAHSQTRPMGAGLELYARRKDGTEFPVDIMLSTAETPSGKIVMSVVRDLSEKRQAEEALLRKERETQYLQEELEIEHSFEEIIGESTDLKRVLKQVETVAATDVTILIQGETGTGKDLVARAIHQLSSRRQHTLVKLNCAAIPTGLLESELFGHERGAFTGAISQKIGRLELAHQGTLFLDEVGDLPLELQPKLLRALQEKEFERLGGTRTIPVDARLIAATNRNLDKMVANREFRSDLYYRLRVFPITVPPLRERRDDIPLLARYFVTKHARSLNKRIESIPPDVLKALTSWDWPGNIRELENFIERAVILSKGPMLRAPLSELKMSAEASILSTDATLETSEREHILRVLREAKGVIAGPKGAAARLGLKRTTLNSKMKKLGIEREDYDN